MHALRVNSSNDIVVPPFECAWLSDENLQLEDGKGCIQFEVKGETDATIILKAAPGSRRWQHMARGPGRDGQAVLLSAEDNYTVIFGSHRNTSLRIEKNGLACSTVRDLPQIQLTSADFRQFWIGYDQGTFKIGAGAPGCKEYIKWEDSDPIVGIRHVGLAAWDKFMAYRNIRSSATLKHEPMCMGSQNTELSKIPSLECLCVSAIEDQLATENAEFICLPLEVVRLLLGRQSLACSEFKLFEGVMEWAQRRGSCPKGLDELAELLPFIRFPIMLSEELQYIEEEYAPEIPELIDLVDEAKLCSHGYLDGSLQVSGFAVEGKRHVTGNARHDAAAQLRFQRRMSPACVELTYMFDGDHNGAVHYLGSGYGQQDFVNPALSGKVKVNASSPSCKFTDTRALTSRKFVRVNMACPSRDGATWWQADLGVHHSLACNYYTVRADASGNFQHDWELQGSQDAMTWTTLKVHSNDHTLKMAGQYASWPVTGHAACMSFRFFRLYQSCSSCSCLQQSSRQLALTYLELYGHFGVDSEFPNA